MLFVMDVGNTCSNFGVYDGKELLAFSRLSTDNVRTDDQYAVELHDILNLKNIDQKKITGGIISSVVPCLTETMRRAIKKSMNIDPLIVGPGIKTGLNIKIDNPSQLGADLVASAVSVIENHTLPCIVFDLGTATTMSVISKKGEFVGAAIAPGLGISLDALVSRTSQLQMVGLDSPERVVGTNTIEAIKSGIIYGNASMIDGMVARVEEEIGSKCTVIATGGRASDVIKHCRREIICDDYLLLEGLKIIYNKNVQ